MRRKSLPTGYTFHLSSLPRPMNTLIQKMRSIYPLSDATVEAFCSQLQWCHFPKRHLIVREGTYCKSVYFIEKGMTRHYWLVNGEEINTSFSIEGGMLFSMDEVYYNQPSQEYIETIEEVDAYRISIDRLNALYASNIELANWGRVIHQNEYRRLHRSHKELITLPAKERYEAFTREFPEVAQRANLGHIASYLGITLPTLSRLRGRK